MRAATGVTYQHPEMLLLPRTVTFQHRHMLPMPRQVTCQHHKVLRAPRKITLRCDEASITLADDWSMIRPWSCKTEPAVHKPPWQRILYENTTLRAPVVDQNFTTCCACHETWGSNIIKHCAKSRSQFIKRGLCHEKWRSNITKYCTCHQKSRSKITKCCPCQPCHAGYIQTPTQIAGSFESGR